MSSTHLLIDSLREVLLQGIVLLESLQDQAYTEKVPVAYSASIGGHYRHCLDHFQTLMTAIGQAELDYDQRKRDPRLEQERLLALEVTQNFLARIELLRPESLQHSIRVRSKVGYAMDQSAWVESSLEREVMYCVAHAVHHFALIGVMCGLQGVNLPKGFGVAPSTIQHQRNRTSPEILAA